VGEIEPYAVPVVDYDPLSRPWVTSRGFASRAGSSTGCRTAASRTAIRTTRTRTCSPAGTRRELAEREWKYVQNYADAKTDVIKDIHARAGLPLA
jgi:hypothetical protein